MDTKSKSQILAKGSFIRTLFFFLNVSIIFFLTPFILHTLGDKLYGLWIFASSFLDFYGIFDLGLASAVQRYVSRALGIKDYKEANVVINTSLFLFSIIGAITLFITLNIAYFVPFFIKNITEVSLFRITILFLGLSFSASFPMRVFQGILSSHLRFDLITVMGIVKLVLKNALIVIFLIKGHGIVALATITLATDLLFYGVTFFLSLGIATYLSFSRIFIVRSRIKSLFEYGAFTFINQIADRLRFNLDNIVISVFLGLNYVTVYSIAFRLIQYFMDFIYTVLGIFTPVFSQYESKGDYDSIRDKLLLTTKMSSYLSILVGGILIIYSRSFIIRWLGDAYVGAYPILIILVIAFTISLMQQPSEQLFYGISKHKFYAGVNLLEGIANLVLSIILVKRFGAAGVALGTAIPMAIVKLFIQPVYMCKIIKLDIKKYYFEIIVPITVKSLLILTAVWFIIQYIIRANFAVLFALISVTSILFSFVVFFIGFNKVERNYFKKAFLSKA